MLRLEPDRPVAPTESRALVDGWVKAVEEQGHRGL